MCLGKAGVGRADAADHLTVAARTQSCLPSVHCAACDCPVESIYQLASFEEQEFERNQTEKEELIFLSNIIKINLTQLLYHSNLQ